MFGHQIGVEGKTCVVLPNHVLIHFLLGEHMAVEDLAHSGIGELELTHDWRLQQPQQIGQKRDGIPLFQEFTGQASGFGIGVKHGYSQQGRSCIFRFPLTQLFHSQAATGRFQAAEQHFDRQRRVGILQVFQQGFRFFASGLPPGHQQPPDPLHRLAPFFKQGISPVQLNLHLVLLLRRQPATVDFDVSQLPTDLQIFPIEIEQPDQVSPSLLTQSQVGCGLGQLGMPLRRVSRCRTQADILILPLIVDRPRGHFLGCEPFATHLNFSAEPADPRMLRAPNGRGLLNQQLPAFQVTLGIGLSQQLTQPSDDLRLPLLFLQRGLLHFFPFAFSGSCCLLCSDSPTPDQAEPEQSGQRPTKRLTSQERSTHLNASKRILPKNTRGLFDKKYD